MKIFFISLMIFFSYSLSFSLPKSVNFNEGIKLAVKNKKPLVVFVSSEYCKWCNVMKSETLSEKSVIKNIDGNFIFSIINIDNSFQKFEYANKTYSLEDFMALLGVRGTPTTIFFDQNGQVLTVLPGFIKPDIYSKILDYVRSSCYEKNISFKEFSSSPKKCLSEK